MRLINYLMCQTHSVHRDLYGSNSRQLRLSWKSPKTILFMVQRFVISANTFGNNPGNPLVLSCRHRGCVLARCTSLRPARSSFLLVLLFSNFSDRLVYAVNNVAELPHLTDVAHAAGYQRVCRAFRVGQCLDGQRLTMALHR